MLPPKYFLFYPGHCDARKKEIKFMIFEQNVWNVNIILNWILLVELTKFHIFWRK